MNYHSELSKIAKELQAENDFESPGMVLVNHETPNSNYGKGEVEHFMKKFVRGKLLPVLGFTNLGSYIVLAAKATPPQVFDIDHRDIYHFYPICLHEGVYCPTGMDNIDRSVFIANAKRNPQHNQNIIEICTQTQDDFIMEQKLLNLYK